MSKKYKIVSDIDLAIAYKEWLFDECDKENKVPTRQEWRTLFALEAVAEKD